MTRFPRPALAALCAFAAAGAVAGCGRDSTTADPAAASPSPRREETVGQFAGRLTAAARAAARGDCGSVREFNRAAGFEIPCGAAGRGYAGFAVSDSADFGTAGLVDFSDQEEPDGGVAVAALNEDRRFRLIQSLVPSSIGLSDHQVGTDAEAPALRDRAVDRFVAAVRRSDCDTYFRLALTPTRDKRKECRLEFDPRAGIQPDLEASPGAEPKLLGDSQAAGLYELSAGDHYRILLAIRNYAKGVREPAPGDAYRIVTYRSQD